MHIMRQLQPPTNARSCIVSNSKFALFFYVITAIGLFLLLTTTTHYRVKVKLEMNREQSPSPCRDADCFDFHRLLADRWPSNKPRGVVIMLIGRRTVSGNGTLFRNFVEHFDENFNNFFNYPVIVFHESNDVGEDEKRNLRSFTRSTLYFQQVVFQLPPFIDETRVSKHCWGLATFGFGYRHMCRFHAKTIYDEPILSTDRLEYILRLDDDSVFNKNIRYDVFRYMRDHNLTYGYAIVTTDSVKCVVGLEDAVREYCDLRNVTPSFPWRMPSIVYNNFEVSKMSFWRSIEYKDFINFIDFNGGIYYNRWGDAPIKSMAVSLFVDYRRVHRFNDIGYSHQELSSA